MQEFRPVEGGSNGWLWGIMAVPVLTIGLMIWLSIRSIWGVAGMSYALTPTTVEIRFGPGTITLARDQIATAEVAEGLTKGRRHYGTAMPGLYEGRWSFAETGRITLFATVQQDLVVIRMKDGTAYGITPDNPRAFVTDLEAGRTGRQAPAKGPKPWAFAAFMGFMTIIMAGVWWMLVYYIRLPQSIRYTIDDERGLIIHGGRLHLVLPYDRITSAEAAEPRGMPWRTFGAGMPGLYWGSFSWKAAGGSLKLYATRLKPLVLIRAEGKTYGITPEDQERFVADLQRRLA